MTQTLLSDKEKTPTLLSDKEKTPTLLSDKENYVKMVKSSDPVLNPVNRSPLSELLVYPTCAKKKTEAKKYVAHVLTSAESIALLEEKKQKKLEEMEEKQRKKKKWEMKRIAREEEKSAKL